jgi:hypothetical protein
MDFDDTLLDDPVRLAEADAGGSLRAAAMAGAQVRAGVEAAAAMGQIRVAFRAYAANRFDPGEVLTETNRLVSEDIESGEGSFATCGYLVLDLDDGQMRAAWAGQPPVILASTRGFEFWQRATGPPVGGTPVDCDASGAASDAAGRTDSDSGKPRAGTRGESNSPTSSASERRPPSCPSPA